MPIVSIVFRRAYMITDLNGDYANDPVLGIGPRQFVLHGDPVLQYMTDAPGNPGHNAHTIFKPTMREGVNGAVLVDGDHGDRWQFDPLTLTRWHEVFAPRIEGSDRIAKFLFDDDDVQKYYVDQFMDDDEWPESPW